MLKQRILTAIILIPLFVLCVLKLSGPNFCYLTGIITLWGAWEWSSFMGINTIWRRLCYPVLVLLALYLTLFYLRIPDVLYAALLTWVVALVLILFYPKLSGIWGKGIVLRGLMGILVLVPSWLAINFIRTAETGPYILLFLFVLIFNLFLAFPAHLYAIPTCATKIF